MVELEVIDTRPFIHHGLTNYYNGVYTGWRSDIKTINVTEKEATELLKLKNGKINCFKKVVKRQTKTEEKS